MSAAVCETHLALARQRLGAACRAFAVLGLALTPDDCAERLRDPEQAALLCQQAESACLSCLPAQAPVALEAALALQEGAMALRRALEEAASDLNTQAKAFGAYRANA